MRRCDYAEHTRPNRNPSLLWRATRKQAWPTLSLWGPPNAIPVHNRSIDHGHNLIKRTNCARDPSCQALCASLAHMRRKIGVSPKEASIRRGLCTGTTRNSRSAAVDRELRVGPAPSPMHAQAQEHEGQGTANPHINTNTNKSGRPFGERRSA